MVEEGMGEMGRGFSVGVLSLSCVGEGEVCSMVYRMAVGYQTMVEGRMKPWLFWHGWKGAGWRGLVWWWW